MFDQLKHFSWMNYTTSSLKVEPTKNNKLGNTLKSEIDWT